MEVVNHWRCSGRSAVRLLLKWTLKVCKKILRNLKTERTSSHKKSVKNQIDSMRLVWYRHENKRLNLVKFLANLDAELSEWSDVSHDWDLLMMRCEKQLDSAGILGNSTHNSSAKDVYDSLFSGFAEIVGRLQKLHEKLGGMTGKHRELAGPIEKAGADGNNGKIPLEQSGVFEQGGR